MNTPKEALIELIPHLPEDVSFDDIMYRLYILTRLAQARKEVAEGDLIAQEEAEAMMNKWII